MSERRRWFLWPYALLWVWVVWFAVYAMRPLTDPDTPWHLAAGFYMLAHHEVPTTDPFSWTMRGYPWVTHEWLFEVVLAWLTKRFQFLGAWLLYAGLHAWTVFMLYRLGVNASGGARGLSALAACTATWVALDFWTLRPQLVSYLLFTVFLWALSLIRNGRQAIIWLLPPLLWLWANAHASASIGIVVILLEVMLSFVPSIGRLQAFCLSWGIRIRLLAASGVGLALGLLNPNHLQAFTYGLLSTNKDLVDNVMEWHSPNFHDASFEQVVLPFLIVVFLVLLARPVHLPLRETLFFGGAFAVTLIYQRFLPYTTICAVPLLAQVLADWEKRMVHLFDWRWLRWVSRGISAVAVAAITLYGVHHWDGVKGPLDKHLSTSAYPVAAVDYLERHGLTKRLLNAYDWGGYLIYRGVPTFVDGRTDVFLKSGVFEDYLALQNVWWQCPELLSKYRFQAALFPPGYSIVTYLESQSDWQVVYQDDTAVVLVHKPAQHTAG
ncbi:MAG: hypothetical protein K6T63_10580 [Alicyclobacillus herbarius]|uniref:hypothetical protein n=1 Tax=Alicyclobacillus herbarius TaxID=122960 RepID=UPI0023553EE2|nr:hypothetical protein [Alicyclobacillus herbarius]MCL6633064.1 hypothetical protein [Alicyclobacillus herbarius]